MYPAHTLTTLSQLITEPWGPEYSFSFPAEETHRLHFQMQWLKHIHD